MGELEPAPTIVTLGPERSDHERAAKFFLSLAGLEGRSQIELVGDLAGEGLERVRSDPGYLLIQCSAHHQGNVINMRHHREIVMKAAFMMPTQEMGLLLRRGVDEPVSLGLMPATEPYLNRSRWPTVQEFTHEQSKPVVGDNLLAGKYDAGITLTAFAEEHPDQLVVGEVFGEVDTAWLVYGNVNSTAIAGLAQLAGVSTPNLFLSRQDS